MSAFEIFWPISLFDVEMCATLVISTPLLEISSFVSSHEISKHRQSKRKCGLREVKTRVKDFSSPQFPQVSLPSLIRGGLKSRPNAFAVSRLH